MVAESRAWNADYMTTCREYDPVSVLHARCGDPWPDDPYSGSSCDLGKVSIHEAVVRLHELAFTVVLWWLVGVMCHVGCQEPSQSFSVNVKREQ